MQNKPLVGNGSVNTHSRGNASLSTLVAVGLIYVPMTTNTTDGPFKGVFRFRPAPSYKREFIRQVSREPRGNRKTVVVQVNRKKSVRKGEVI
jgi:hypothetical protein